MPKGMRRLGGLVLPTFAAVVSVSQIGATSAEVRDSTYFDLAAVRALDGPSGGRPLSDPGDVLDLLAVDPHVRILRTEAAAAALRGIPVSAVQIETPEGMDPLIAHRVASALVLLDQAPRVRTPVKPFDFRRLVSRPAERPARGKRSARPSPAVDAALASAARITGVPYVYLYRTAQRESTFDVHAKAATSSALGLFQFLDETWLRTVKIHGHKHGLSRQAALIARRANGTHTVADPQLRRMILDLRRDPRLSALLAAEFTRDNAIHFQAAIGRAPGQGEAYMAHFLGAEGAVQMVRAARWTPHVAGATLFPKAARANRSIFYDRFGRPRDVGTVAAILRRKGEE